MPFSKEHYHALGTNYSESDSDISSLRPSRPLRFASSTLLLTATSSILFLIVVVESFYLSRIPRLSPTGLSLIPNLDRTVGLSTPFNSPNETVAAAAWNAIEAGHGDVSIDPSWASARGLPPSFFHPFDSGKMVYVLEAYHAIHCLKVLRKHYMALLTPMLDGRLAAAPSWDLEHDAHCFDQLRQHVMCHADDTLMYSSGHLDVGVGQTRKCRDWDALRDWATERSACWYDHIDPSPEGEVWWGQCGSGDGLPIGSLG